MKIIAFSILTLSLLTSFAVVFKFTKDTASVINLAGKIEKELEGTEYCYRGFVYLRMYSSAVPVFNKYGMPLRCDGKKAL